MLSSVDSEIPFICASIVNAVVLPRGVYYCLTHPTIYTKIFIHTIHIDIAELNRSNHMLILNFYNVCILVMWILSQHPGETIARN